MSRLLLLLCCATVLVIGIEGDVASTDNGSSSSVEGKLAKVVHNAETVVKEGIKAIEAVASAATEDKHLDHDKPIAPTILPGPPETTSSTTVAPTTPPTTSTTASTTTTMSTTTTSTTTTTTNAPTTPAVVTTTVAPKPVPPPTAGKWTVANETGSLCVIVQMAVQFNISYVNANQTEVYKVFDMPANGNITIASGVCGKLEQNLTLTWPSVSNVANDKDNMTLHFTKNETTQHYSLHHLELVLSASEFPNSTEPIVLMHEGSTFSTGLTNSYRCLKQQKLKLKHNGGNDTSSYLTVSDLQFQAFKSDNSAVFGLAKDCAFDTPDMVPIAVGCALAGLIVVVLFAYLVGRRRIRGRGYNSM